MTDLDIHETEHQITVVAPAKTVFELIAGVIDWPRIFPPSVHVEYLERVHDQERIRIWATANGEVKSWISRRYLDRDRLRVRFRQEVSQHPVLDMGGEWFIEPLSSGRTFVRLKHDFRVAGNEPRNVDWVQRAVDRNSNAELASLKKAAEQGDLDELLLTFDDVVRVDSPLRDIYAFIYEAGQWQQRIQHVARVVLEEDTPNVQLLEMDTRTADGSTHTTKSIRICFPDDRIVYKQLQPPGLMSVHTGQWRFEHDGDGTAVTSTHTVLLDRSAIPKLLEGHTVAAGEYPTVGHARKLVREALGGNSTATIRAADEYAKRQRQGLEV